MDSGDHAPPGGPCKKIHGVVDNPLLFSLLAREFSDTGWKPVPLGAEIRRGD
jgi:hypothetical protein